MRFKSLSYSTSEMCFFGQKSWDTFGSSKANKFGFQEFSFSSEIRDTIKMHICGTQQTLSFLTRSSLTSDPLKDL